MPAKAGHNIKGISEEDKEILLAIHTRKLIADRRAKKAAADVEKQHIADLKNDGFDDKEVKDYIDVMLSDDQKKIVDKFNMMRRNREKTGAIPPQAKDLFSDRVTREQQIERDGYETGMHGFDRVPRHTRGGSEDDIWFEGYDRGRAKYDERFPIIIAAIEAAEEAEKAAKQEAPLAKGENPFAFADQGERP